MARYHINKHTGRIGLCRAQKNCPFGDLVKDHYDTRAAAQLHYERALAAHLIKPPVIKDSLKKMDANDLAHEILQRMVKQGGSEDSYSEILELTSMLHANQRRITRVPGQEALYIEHPLRVSLRLLRHGVQDEATVKAALFHDVVEDGAVTFSQDFLGKTDLTVPQARAQLLEYIQNTHGDDVSSTVNAVTNPYVTAEVIKTRTLQEKNQEYLAHVTHEVESSPRAMLVKLSDFLDNAGSLHHTDFSDNRVKTKRQAVKYRPVADVFLQELSNGNPYLNDEGHVYFEHRVKQATLRMDFIIDKYSSLA